MDDSTLDDSALDDSALVESESLSNVALDASVNSLSIPNGICSRNELFFDECESERVGVLDYMPPSRIHASDTERGGGRSVKSEPNRDDGYRTWDSHVAGVADSFPHVGATPLAPREQNIELKTFRIMEHRSESSREPCPARNSRLQTQAKSCMSDEEELLVLSTVESDTLAATDEDCLEEVVVQPSCQTYVKALPSHGGSCTDGHRQTGRSSSVADREVTKILQYIPSDRDAAWSYPDTARTSPPMDSPDQADNAVDDKFEILSSRGGVSRMTDRPESKVQQGQSSSREQSPGAGKDPDARMTSSSSLPPVEVLSMDRGQVDPNSISRSNVLYLNDYSLWANATRAFYREEHAVADRSDLEKRQERRDRRKKNLETPSELAETVQGYVGHDKSLEELLEFIGDNNSSGGGKGKPTPHRGRQQTDSSKKTAATKQTQPPKAKPETKKSAVQAKGSEMHESTAELSKSSGSSHEKPTSQMVAEAPLPTNFPVGVGRPEADGDAAEPRMRSRRAKKRQAKKLNAATRPPGESSHGESSHGESSHGEGSHGEGYLGENSSMRLSLPLFTGDQAASIQVVNPVDELSKPFSRINFPVESSANEAGHECLTPQGQNIQPEVAAETKRKTEGDNYAQEISFKVTSELMSDNMTSSANAPPMTPRRMSNRGTNPSSSASAVPDTAGMKSDAISARKSEVLPMAMLPVESLSLTCAQNDVDSDLFYGYESLASLEDEGEWEECQPKKKRNRNRGTQSDDGRKPNAGTFKMPMVFAPKEPSRPATTPLNKAATSGTPMVSGKPGSTGSGGANQSRRFQNPAGNQPRMNRRGSSDAGYRGKFETSNLAQPRRESFDDSQFSPVLKTNVSAKADDKSYAKIVANETGHLDQVPKPDTMLVARENSSDANEFESDKQATGSVKESTSSSKPEGKSDAEQIPQSTDRLTPENVSAEVGEKSTVNKSHSSTVVSKSGQVSESFSRPPVVFCDRLKNEPKQIGHEEISFEYSDEPSCDASAPPHLASADTATSPIADAHIDSSFHSVPKCGEVTPSTLALNCSRPIAPLSGPGHVPSSKVLIVSPFQKDVREEEPIALPPDTDLETLKEATMVAPTIHHSDASDVKQVMKRHMGSPAAAVSPSLRQQPVKPELPIAPAVLVRQGADSDVTAPETADSKRMNYQMPAAGRTPEPRPLLSAHLYVPSSLGARRLGLRHSYYNAEDVWRILYNEFNGVLKQAHENPGSVVFYNPDEDDDN